MLTRAHVDAPPLADHAGQDMTDLPRSTCRNDGPDEVIVCSSQQQAQRYRLPALDGSRYADAPVRANMRLGNGTLSLHTEDKEIGGGLHSKRAMITFKLPLGGK